MAYIYESFVINPTEENTAVAQLAQKIKELVPNITIEGPFYYQDDKEKYPNAKSYVIKHVKHPEISFVLLNNINKYTNLEGKPKGAEGTYSEIEVSVILKGKCADLGYYGFGTSGEKLFCSYKEDTYYVTLVAGEDYLLWNISTSPPNVAVPLYQVYTPLYSMDREIHALMFPALKCYYPGSSYNKYVNTYKDTMLTEGGLVPSKSNYGIEILTRSRYAYPKMDITKKGTPDNYKPVLTKNIEVYGQTRYGSEWKIDGENTRIIDLGLYGREAILALPYENKPDYPKNGILTIDGADYYIYKEVSKYASDGIAVYCLFEL
ncbi:MAG: hypothetical protein AB9856_03050 [Cellulosilyticaceae bacterium]